MSSISAFKGTSYACSGAQKRRFLTCNINHSSLATRRSGFREMHFDVPAEGPSKDHMRDRGSPLTYL